MTKQLGIHANIYLAGPIGGLTWDEATGWRDSVTKLLQPMTALSPMRDMGGIKLKDSCFVSDGQISNTGNAKGGQISFEKLFQRDFSDVMNCQAVLFNFLGAKRQSFGTICELAWAFQRNMPRVVVIEDGNPNCNPFGEQMYEHRVHTLADGVNYLRKYFGWPQYDANGSY